jgi:hypothetical protein
MFQAEQFPTVIYFPGQDVVTAQAQQQLSRVIVAGTRSVEDPVFHFRVSLVFANDSCIRLDMSPAGVGSNIWVGFLGIHYKSYARSRNNTIAFNVPAALGTRQFLRLSPTYLVTNGTGIHSITEDMGVDIGAMSYCMI